MIHARALNLEEQRSSRNEMEATGRRPGDRCDSGAIVFRYEWVFRNAIRALEEAAVAVVVEEAWHAEGGRPTLQGILKAVRDSRRGGG